MGEVFFQLMGGHAKFEMGATGGKYVGRWARKAL
jgi:hypothetical protein